MKKNKTEIFNVINANAVCRLIYIKDNDCNAYKDLQVIKGERNKIIQSLKNVAECYLFKGYYEIRMDGDYFISEIIPLR